MRIKMAETTRAGGVPFMAGTVVELDDDAVAQHLVDIGLATETKEQVTDMSEPQPEPTPAPEPTPEPEPEPTPATTGTSARRALSR